MPTSLSVNPQMLQAAGDNDSFAETFAAAFDQVGFSAFQARGKVANLKVAKKESPSLLTESQELTTESPGFSARSELAREQSKAPVTNGEDVELGDEAAADSVVAGFQRSTTASADYRDIHMVSCAAQMAPSVILDEAAFDATRVRAHVAQMAKERGPCRSRRAVNTNAFTAVGKDYVNVDALIA